MNHTDNAVITKGRLFNRFFITVWLIAFMYNFGNNMLNNAITLYIDSLGGSTTTSGLIALPFAALAILSRFVAGYTTDHIGRRFTMALGCLVFAVGIVCFGFVPSLALLFVFRAFHGAGYSLANTGAGAANIDTAPPEKLNTAAGLFYIPSAITVAIGGSLTVLFSDRGNFKALFLVCAASLLVGAVLAFSCNYEKRYPVTQERTENSGRQYRGLEKFFDRCAVKPAVVIMLICAICALFNAFSLLFAGQHGIANPGIFFTLSAVTMLALNLTAAPLMERFGATKLILASGVLLVIPTVGLALTYNAFFYYFLGLSYGVMMGACFPVLYALAMAPAAPERRGAASSLALLATDLGVGLGSPVWGLVISVSGYRVCFLLCAGVMLCAMVLSVLYFRKRP